MFLETFQKTNLERLWEDLRRVQNALDEDFFPMSISERKAFPPINIFEDADGATAIVQIPGVDPEKIELSVTGDLLNISGQRETDSFNENISLHRNELWKGKFSRSLRLPFTIDSNNIKANSKNGILEIRLPRTEEEKPKKISITAD
ncbi:MAG: Hsp20/alpha crystallin family protein [Spirochaetia bacterium]|nr:Hsp20/alpha crystallin family protein [Spirochaetia bacterium]